MNPEFLSGLNDPQRSAVTNENSSLLVLAGFTTIIVPQVVDCYYCVWVLGTRVLFSGE